MKLLTTDHQLHSLMADAEAARGSTMKVDIETLRNIIEDHFSLNSEVLRKHGSLPETEDGKPVKRRVVDAVPKLGPGPRPGSTVWADGKEYTSILAAFEALGLPIARHQKFRVHLKSVRKADFNNITFEYR